MKAIEWATACAVGCSLLGGCAVDDPAADMPAEPGTTGLRVFVTYGKYAGDLTAYLDSAANGLAAGDEICQVRATAAQLGGKWRAWLSSSEIDALDRMAGHGPWTLTNGEPAFANRAQLQTEPSTSLHYDEHGDFVDDSYVWTGTRAGGVHSASTCSNWTSTSTEGVSGYAIVGEFGWTDSGTVTCTWEAHLICLEQAL